MKSRLLDNHSHKNQSMPAIRQAVILAGGLGTRLSPITDVMPKPMIPFYGKPFLEYLVNMLKEQGVERFVFLVGYLADQIVEYFGDGSLLDVDIIYSEMPVEADTGTRVRHALPLLDSTFMLLYCDNYWPVQIDKMWSSFIDSGAPVQVTIYDNKDQFTRDNIIVSEEGFVEIYDKTRTTSGLQGVDIGFLIMKKDIVKRLPANENISFEKTLYPELVAKHELAGYVSSHRYYSVGDHKRLPITDRFLCRTPLIILDRDGVLNKCMPKAEYVTSWDDWEWLPGALEALRLYRNAGWKVAVVTNQAGIARHVMTEHDLMDIHQKMISESLVAGGRIDVIEFCPHGWHDECDCRKPKPGMLYAVQRKFHIDLTHTIFIGDDDRDGQAAEAVGAIFHKVDSENSLLDITRNLLSANEEIYT